MLWHLRRMAKKVWKKAPVTTHGKSSTHCWPGPRRRRADVNSAQIHDKQLRHQWELVAGCGHEPRVGSSEDLPSGRPLPPGSSEGAVVYPEAVRWLQQAVQQLNSAAATLRSVRDREQTVTSAELLPALVALNGAVAMTHTAVWLMNHLPPIDA